MSAATALGCSRKYLPIRGRMTWIVFLHMVYGDQTLQNPFCFASQYHAAMLDGARRLMPSEVWLYVRHEISENTDRVHSARPAASASASLHKHWSKTRDFTGKKPIYRI